MEIIKLNLIPSGVNPTCHCSQYDNGRVIRIELFDGLTPYVLQSGDTVTLNVRKPDNTIVTASVTATQGNNYVDIVTTEQICACVGYNLCDLTITNGLKVIGTLNFIMQVERDVLADGIPSQSVIEDLDELVQEAVGDQYYTKTETDAALALKANQSDVDNIDDEVADLYSQLGEFWQVGKNLFNKDTTNMREDKYVAYNNGNLVNNNTYNCYVIPVVAGQKISLNTSYCHLAFSSDADLDLTTTSSGHVISGYISGAVSSASGIEGLTVPENAKVLVLSVSKANVSTTQVEYGEHITTFEPYGKSILGDKIRIKSIPENRIIFNSDIYTHNYTLKADGSGDFTDLRACIEYINSLSYYEQINIYLETGTYDIRALYTNEEWSASGFVGLKIPRNVAIIGKGKKRDEVLITCTSETATSAISTLNFTDNIKIENLTIYGNNLRYVIHDDYSDFYFANENGNYRIINNVDFIGENMVYNMPYGAGTQGGSNWIFNNCRFINKNSGMCFSVHDRYTTSQTFSILPERFEFNNCEFIGYGNANVRLSPAVSKVEQTVIFNGCKLKYIRVDSQFTGDENSTTVYNILGSGNTPKIKMSFYNNHDKLSIPRFSDQVNCGINTSGSAFAIGDYIKLDVNHGVIAGTENDNDGVALNAAPSGDIVYFE